MAGTDREDLYEPGQEPETDEDVPEPETDEQAAERLRTELETAEGLVSTWLDYMRPLQAVTVYRVGERFGACVELAVPRADEIGDALELRVRESPYEEAKASAMLDRDQIEDLAGLLEHAGALLDAVAISRSTGADLERTERGNEDIPC